MYQFNSPRERNPVNFAELLRAQLIYTEPNHIMKIKVTVNGETHEVEQSDLELGDLKLVDPENPPKGLFNQTGVDEIVSNRVDGLKKPDELLKDEDFRKKVLSQFDITLDEDGKPKGLKGGKEDDEAKFKTWSEQHLKPVKSELEQASEKLSTFKSRQVEADLFKAANKHKIDQKHLEPLIEGGQPYLIKELKDSFKYDDELGQTVAVDGEGNPRFNGNGKKMTADEWIAQESKGGVLKNLVQDNRNRSSGFQSGGEGNVVTISESDAKNSSKFEAAEKEAKESGATLKIIED